MTNREYEGRFERFEELLSAFAASVNGCLNVRQGFSNEDVSLAQSEFTDLLVAAYRSIQHAKGRSIPEWDFSKVDFAAANFQFKSFSIDIPFETWSITFESRCVSRAVLEKLSKDFPSEPLFPMTITCCMRPCTEFIFYMISGGKSHPLISIGKGRSLGRFLKPFTPQSIRRTHEIAAQTHKQVKFATSFLEGNYYAESNDPDLAYKFINAPTVREHFARCPINSLTIAPSGEEANLGSLIWQASFNFDGKSIDPLHTMLDLTKASLLRLEELNVVSGL